jgi:tetratricopeptide (TPR) repeat protein
MPRLVRTVALSVLGAVAIIGAACGGWWTPKPSEGPKPALPAPAPVASDSDETEGAIRFLEARVKSDPDDFIAQNKLAAYYLRRQRETGDISFIDLASRTARASLNALKEEQNPDGLAALAQAELSRHDFSSARENALRLTELAPRESFPYQILGDAELELGNYEKATEAFNKMRELESSPSVASEARRARLALLHGDHAGAVLRLNSALLLALDERVVDRETVAWCRWQLGEVAFASGDYKRAEEHYRDALVTFPDYHRALASFGRTRAALGDLAGAIEHYERVTRILPDPSYVASLGDLYKLTGREQEAAQQYALVEKIARLGKGQGELYNRQLAYFFADHDMKADEAYSSAVKEYAVRRDIYGADVLAWAALKAGRLEEARKMSREALRLGTRDARLFYHAGMIASAAGDRTSARDYLERALKLSPQFDPLQATVARSVLEQ